MSNQDDRGVHDVMIRIPLPYYEKLCAIAAREKRGVGVQALVFAEAGIEAYLEENPAIADQAQSVA